MISGKISDVTVYQGTALVSRLVEIPDGPAVSVEIVVSGLPSATDPNSVYADQAQGVVVRSVACRIKTPDQASQAPSPNPPPSVVGHRRDFHGLNFLRAIRRNKPQRPPRKGNA
jgi:hypothetical protein